MKRMRIAAFVSAGLCAAALAVGVATADETITGRLVEANCAAMAGAEPSPEHVACMVRCARNGDPIGIMTDGGLYRITGDWAASHPDELAALMAKQVRATGEVSEAGGERLLAAATIEAAD